MTKKPTNEELKERLNKLEKEAIEHKHTEEVLHKQAYDLGERVKELDCLYNISRLIEKPGISLEEILQGTVNLIPPAWQYPEITCARIIFEGKEFRTENFTETTWKQTENIRAYDESIGTLEVYYLEERAERDEGPFLKEERGLLTVITEQLGRITERMRIEEKIQYLNLVLRAIRGVNQLISQEKDRDRFLKGVCDILIENRGYYSTWIALLDESSELVTSAEAGLGENFLPMVERLKRGALADCGQRALTQSDLVVTRDPPSTCTDCPLSDQYSGRGAMTIRLEHGGKLYGLLCASIPRDFIADAEEQSLFQEVAMDISFALNSIELEEERKQAEEALRESEERFRALTESTSDWIWEADQNGIYTYAGPRVKDLLGYEPEEVIGKTLFDFMPPDEAERVGGLFRDIVDSRKPFRGLENTNLHKDGQPVVLETSGVPILDAAGNLIGYRGMDRDTTEHKQAEKALRESEEKYRTILESIEDGYFEVDIRGNFTFFNDSLCKILGYPRDELMGMNNRQYMDEETAKKVYQTFNKVYTTGKPAKGFEWEIIRKDGTKRYVQSSVSPMKDSEGQPIGFRGIVRDISSRKHAEEALRTSETEKKSILNAMPDIVLFQDTNLSIRWGNEAAGRSVDKTQEELVGCFCYELWHGLSEPCEGCPVLIALETGSSAKSIMTTPDERWWEIAGEPVCDMDGKVVGAIEIACDITEKKKLEAQLQRAQTMETVGTLAGGVAHDLNNILSGLVTYPELILLDLPEDSPLRNAILTIQKSGEKAVAVVQDLLTLARRGVAVTEVVNLNLVISEYVESPEHERLISFHPGVQVKTNLEADVLNILGSPAHLSKTVMNLVSNAAEAMSEGGTISISTENRYIDRPIQGYDSIEEGDYVILTVSDTGMGISPEDMGRIFEPFYTKKVMGRSGTGLGMAVVWGTVKDHNGYIDVQSTEGKGTTFSLYFPVTRKEVTKDKALVSIDDYMGKGESILVVDDVEEQREIATKILKKLGYSVSTVSSGEEAVDYLKDNSVDLLILDMIMDPGIDGLETYKRIIEFHPGQKALIVSGFSETKRVKKAQKLGAGAYVKKPFLLEKIGIAVRDELDK